jgi:glycosyltransferase involved in cell wall biosynthesis
MCRDSTTIVDRTEKGGGRVPPLVLHLATIDSTVRHLLLPQLLFLKKAGYTVAAAGSPGPGAEIVEASGIPFIPVRIDRALVSLHHPFSVLRLVRLLRAHEVQVLHVHTPIAAALGRVAARLAGTPLVLYTAHGFYFHEYLPRRYRGPLILIERMLGRLTHHLLTQSAEDYETALRSGISKPQQTTILGNGVDVDLFLRSAERRETVRRELGLSSEPVVAFTGRFVHEKGLRELLQAMARVRKIHPDIRLLIIGASLPTDRDAAESDLVVQVKQLGLGDAMIATGFTERVPDFLSAADLFVLPSYREGMPRSILEAMAAGKAVVATDIRGCREEVVDGVTGYLVPRRDADRLAAAIRKLLEDPALRARMGSAGQRRAKERFDEKLVFERLLAVYRRYLPL